MMIDVMRWRYGDTNPVVAAVDADTVIRIGDLVWLDGDDIKPAAALPPTGLPATDLTAFKAKFLGVAMQRSRQGDTAPVRVATTGVFAFDCASASFELGDFIGAAADGSGLSNSAVAKTAGQAAALGRAARRESSAATCVLVDIRSTVMTGGV